MSTSTKGTALAMAVLAVALGVAIVGARAQAPTASGQAPGNAQAPTPAQSVEAKPKLAEEVYKNTQVLKGIPADQLEPTMDFIAASLGVQCEHCHVQGAPEKDDKNQKKTARKMIEMTNALNKDSFEGRRQVTCFSCHRGAGEPVAIPLVSDGTPRPEAAGPRTPGGPNATPPPNADQVLAKFVEAVGGADSIQKVTSRILRGNLIVGERQIAVEVFAKAPYKRAAVVHLPNGGESITAFDGQTGWLGNTGQPPRVMTTAQAAAAKLDADFYFAAHVKETLRQVRPGRPEKINDRDTYVLMGRPAGQPPVRLYFDQQTGLLVRQVRFLETALGRLPTQIDYDDYRSVDGVKIPFRWTLARPNGRFTIQIEKVEQNVTIDDSRFAAPPAPPATTPDPPSH